MCVSVDEVRDRLLAELASLAPAPAPVEVAQLAEGLRRGEYVAVADLPVLDLLLQRRALSAARTPWASALLVIAYEESLSDLRRALRAGVGGVLLYADLDALAVAVSVVRAGQLCVPASLRQPLSRPVLSQRERQTLALAVAGFTNAEVAARLFVAPSTVKTHLSAAFQKLGVRSRSEAAALVHDPDEGLAELVLGAIAVPATFAGADAHPTFVPASAGGLA